MTRLSFILFFIAAITSSRCFSQNTAGYSVYKLENKIGEEQARTETQNQAVNEYIDITTNDRGAAMQLHALLVINRNAFKYTSSGNTSRFKKENIDTTFQQNGKFPLSDNGSIKLRELLIDFWVKAGKPASVTSAMNGKPINISIIGHEADQLKTGELTILKINNGLDEILWLDKTGKAVYLTYCDTEGDKREVIANGYTSLFNVFTQKSNKYLIKQSLQSMAALGRRFNTIAIVGGNIVDVENNGELHSNTMLLLKNGKIAYIGTVNKDLIPQDAHIINASGKFVIPGLWNMHAHLFHPEYLTTEIQAGVTTVRDMGNEFNYIQQLKDAVNSQPLPAPTIHAAGLLDGKSAYGLGIMLASNNKEIRENVKKYHDAGFDQIKIYSYVKKKYFSAIVREAALYNMDVVGHLPIGYTINYFIENGMKSISHIHYFMNSLKWGGNLRTNNQPLLDKLKANKTYIDPTLNVYALTGDSKIANYNKLVKLLFDAGVPIVAGTDNEGTIAGEIQNYVNLGLSTLDAIRTATIVPARMMKADAESGSIATGKNADLLILNDNPLLNVKTLNHINTIVKGQWVIEGKP